MIRCEDIPMLISASLDDELSIEERLELESHLVDCDACRDLEDAFEWVNGLVRHDVVLTVDVPPALARVRAAKRSRVTDHVGWIGAAAAAALVLFSTAAVLMRSPKASASQMMAPLTEVQVISQHKEAAQETVLKTLEWELRALRLQLAAANANPVRREALSGRLETLVQRVDRMRQSYVQTGEPS